MKSMLMSPNDSGWRTSIMRRLYSSSMARNDTMTSDGSRVLPSSCENVRCFSALMRLWMERTYTSTGMGLAAMCSDSSRNTSRRASAAAATPARSSSVVPRRKSGMSPRNCASGPKGRPCMRPCMR